jgi:hypothetical protein
MEAQKYLLLLMTTVCSWFLLGFPVFAFDNKSNRHSLYGLKEMGVLIELPSVFRETPLSERQIRNDVELKLRSAGIKVGFLEESVDLANHPCLYVHVSSIKPQSGFPCIVPFYVDISLYQEVYLKRDPSITLTGETWSAGEVVLSETQRAPSFIRGYIRELMDSFISAYLSVNPKGGN